jgi:hypothetical protein
MGTPYTPPGKDPTGYPHPQPPPPDPCVEQPAAPSAADLDAVAEKQAAAEATE